MSGSQYCIVFIVMLIPLGILSLAPYAAYDPLIVGEEKGDHMWESETKRYYVKLNADQTYTIDISTTWDVDLTLTISDSPYMTSGKTVDHESYDGETMIFDAEKSGNYYIHVFAKPGGSGYYDIKIGRGESGDNSASVKEFFNPTYIIIMLSPSTIILIIGLAIVKPQPFKSVKSSISAKKDSKQEKKNLKREKKELEKYRFENLMKTSKKKRIIEEFTELEGTHGTRIGKREGIELAQEIEEKETQILTETPKTKPVEEPEEINTLQNKQIEIPLKAYTGKKPYIFVSYAHSDKAKVYPEMAWIKKKGFHIWYDEGIPPSSEWPAEIEKAILECDSFIVFITPHAIESSLLRNEVNLALNKNKPFLSIFLEPADLKYGLRLRMGQLQSILKYEVNDTLYQQKVVESLRLHFKKEST